MVNQSKKRSRAVAIEGAEDADNEDMDLMEPTTPPPLERQDAIETDRCCKTCPSKLGAKDPPYARQCYDCYRDERTKRPCRVCEKHTIPVSEPEWKDVCGSCFKHAAMKPCSACNKYVIRSTDPKWKSICQDCYSAKNWKRTCDMCNDRPIRDDLPAYVTKCSVCYLKAKKETHDTCPECPAGERSCWKRIEAPMCRNCMVGQGLVKVLNT